VVVDGGMVSLEVDTKMGPDVHCRVVDPGIILSRANLTFRRDGAVIRARNSMLPVLSSKARSRGPPRPLGRARPGAPPGCALRARGPPRGAGCGRRDKTCSVCMVSLKASEWEWERAGGVKRAGPALTALGSGTGCLLCACWGCVGGALSCGGRPNPNMMSLTA